MTRPPSLKTAAGEFRRAIHAGLHEEAGAWADDYCRAVEAALATLDPAGPDAERLRQEALELIEWGRRATLAARAHYVLQFSSLPDPRRYGPPTPGRPSTFAVLV